MTKVILQRVMVQSSASDGDGSRRLQLQMVMVQADVSYLFITTISVCTPFVISLQSFPKITEFSN